MYLCKISSINSEIIEKKLSFCDVKGVVDYEQPLKAKLGTK
jgi:hypothetical protein